MKDDGRHLLRRSLLACKILLSELKTKPPDNKMTKGHQTVERPLRMSINSINMLQVKLVQMWTSNGCTNKRHG